jgi:hypothetical protein
MYLLCLLRVGMVQSIPAQLLNSMQASMCSWYVQIIHTMESDLPEI